MQQTIDKKYIARFHHFGAMIDETRLLVARFDPATPINAWVDELIRENVLGKTSRSWTREVTRGVFIQRFVNGYFENAWKHLRVMEDKGADLAVIRTLMYYHTAKNDRFLYDFATTELCERFYMGHLDIAADDVLTFIQKCEPERFNKPWSDYVQRRLSRGVMATLRDFGVLEGKAKKRIANFYLPIEAFAYIAFLIQSKTVSGEMILNSSDWKLFLLNSHSVERMFLEAHQHGLLNYNAAGNIVRIEFKHKSIEELADDIASRAR
jgi:hypothetical protein